MNSLFGSSSSSKVLSVYLDEPTKIYGAGEFVSGTATLLLDLDANGVQSKLVSLDTSLRVEMTTTFHKPTRDRRRPEIGAETTRLHTLDTILWKGSEHPPSATVSGQSLVKVPFMFKVPGSAALPMPPSFEGGSRKNSSTEGHAVARVQYYVKFVARKTGFTSAERLIVPFIVMPSPTTDPRFVPPPIIPRTVLVPAHPPRPPLESDGWVTATSKVDFREGWTSFSVKKTLLVKLSVPSLPTFPRAHPIPFHLSLLILSPPQPSQSSSSAPSRLPSLPIPTPATDLTLSLVRNVFVQAHGKSQVLHQPVGLVTDFGSERRVWTGEPGWQSGPELQGRWGVEVVVVGEMEVGYGETRNAGPSFGVDATKGLLSCGYHLRLNLTLKGGKKLEIDPFLPLGISSTFASTPSDTPPPVPPKPGETPPALPPRRVVGTTADLPPSYLEVDVFGEGLATEPKGDVKTGAEHL